ncbi:hypothetical protein LMG28688_01598 [Paraburkholderia caffeinitolerans]|uniref:Myb-like domain-containing protein n=1 Tax=Paraburkholderia caffeinitolerans TaxID=1723730 RepID=A0A6J5FS39_9BURK|nr:hypothetical protein [Paraburkholderia caffeinitolerans]CAB3783193.1 hypothetical protein LMG28688_01598 [Paraburkholderia caffeinitolerans]
MRQFWTSEEDDVLRDVARRGVGLIGEMHRLPGRTHSAARQHAWAALKLKLGGRVWTDDERETLRRIYASDESVKHAVGRLLPGRTYSMAKQEAVRLDIASGKVRRVYGYSLIFYRAERLLADGRKVSVKQLAAELGSSISATKRALKRQHGVRTRVGDYGRLSNGHWEDLWMLGSGPDAPRPPRRTAAQVCRLKRARAKVREGRIDPFATLRQQIAA